MGRGLWWSFGEPREENGELTADFYYQIGKHVELRLPWPTRRFAEAGGLSIHVGGENRDSGWPHDITAKTEETGRRLYDLLGKEAQASLIRTFAEQNGNGNNRVLHLLFPAASSKNREICLTLEDLPWELLHDGEEFISWRYSLQIIRGHTRDVFPAATRHYDVASWGILLVTPFVFSGEEVCHQVGLEPLPLGMEEVKTLRTLEDKTHGLVAVGPYSPHRRNPGGIVTFPHLREYLLGENAGRYQIIHFVGHGVIYDDEPCLCFEKGEGGIDYVSVDRLRQLFLSVRDLSPRHELPPVLFLNACSSSSRGRYSSGFASGLHDLGMCVLGYHSDIYDDDKPLQAADRFYRSLCVDQSLQTPQLSPTVITAIGAARRRIRDEAERAKPVWGSLRAYLPSNVSFTVRGRGPVERGLQTIYSHFAQWMNPQDYTDHLSIVFQFAILFGALMGFINLAFIFPETLLVRHYTYQEIVSEILRVFLVGPLSFLAAAIFVSYQTLQNHRFLLHRTGKIPLSSLFKHSVVSLPTYLLAGAAFGVLFTYSFSRLDLLTTQITAFAALTRMTISSFWYSFVGLITGMVTFSLLAAGGFCLWRKETLHSYRTFYWILILYPLLLAAYIADAFYNDEVNVWRTGGWALFSLLNIGAFSSVTVKTLKETSWRALQKSEPTAALSWRKLVPLLGGAFLVVFCYYLLEESVRFEQQTIQSAIVKRRESIAVRDYDPHIERILERALRQRAIHEIPDSIMDNPEEIKQDWLLSLVCADYYLFRARQRNDNTRMEDDLAASQVFLAQSALLKSELVFKDYYCNIKAMLEFLLAGCATSDEEKNHHFAEALYYATTAVEKDNHNFAYLDTLARIEARIAEHNNDPRLLKKAAEHIRQARWRAFFLRSSMADQIRLSIEDMAETIQRRIETMDERNRMSRQRIYP